MSDGESKSKHFQTLTFKHLQAIERVRKMMKYMDDANQKSFFLDL